MRHIALLCLLILSMAGLQGCNREESDATVKIGIIEPLQHKAMDEIVAGFTQTLQQYYDKPVVIKVENAQNDANLQRAIIQKMRDAHYDVILPIGMDATQMSITMVRSQPIVSMASDISEHDRKRLKPCNVAVVHDEISSAQIMAFVHAAYPSMKHLTLIHSAANKVFPEVKKAVAAGKKYGITVHPLMVSTLPELMSVTRALPADTQGVLVLKDHLIVSGIGTVAKAAALKHIPVMSSDEGSVKEGASFALGVPERQIGSEGAVLTAAVLNGKSVCSLPIVDMTKLSVFMNRQALQQSAQSPEVIMTAADKFQYQIRE